MHNVKDKVFFVTGGAAGIGAGLVTTLLERGAKFVAAADLDVKAGKELEANLEKKYGANRIKFIKCDITTKELDDAYDKILKEQGYIDTVINNAGIMNDSPNVYLKEIEVNVTALIKSSVRAYHFMRKDKGGRGGTVINISSIVGLRPTPYLPIYSATKLAVLAFTKCFGSEPYYEKSQVRFLTVCFGVTQTSLISPLKCGGVDKELDDEIIEKINMLPLQNIDSAVNGLIDVYQKGDSASTWLVSGGLPAVEMTESVTRAIDTMGNPVVY